MATWRFAQALVDREPHMEEPCEADLISALEFDESGDFLAAGDRGGRIAIFSITDDRSMKEEDVDMADGAVEPEAFAEYDFFYEFQSHDPEFDYLKSIEIEEKINKIRWCKHHSNALFLLSTNDKTIKLWKVHEKRQHTLSRPQHNNWVGSGSGDDDTLDAATRQQQQQQQHDISFPSIATADPTIVASPRRVFANGHDYHINSISLNSDCETYISSDDLRINLWNLSIKTESFNIVDIKPENLENLTEVITAAEFHPQHCNLFMYSSSKGAIKLADMRAASLCDTHAKSFHHPEDAANRSFFSEILSSISDVRFSDDGRYIVARDYLTIKVWDVNMESCPVKIIPIHSHLKSKLCDLYENDCIFDKFDSCFTSDSRHVIAGTYQNAFHIYDWEESGDAGRSNDLVIEAVKMPPERLFSTRPPHQTENFLNSNLQELSFYNKVLNVTAHPKSSAFAVASITDVLLFTSTSANTSS